MNPSKFYAILCQSINDAELRKCARTLSYHIGEQNAVSLDEIAGEVYGHHGGGGAVAEHDRRKTRQLIEILIEDYGYPVCSRSGAAGRWMPATKEEAITAAVEREKRARKLTESARQIRAHSDKLPAALPQIGQADNQPRLI